LAKSGGIFFERKLISIVILRIREPVRTQDA
jgi:hypothetical protein